MREKQRDEGNVVVPAASTSAPAPGFVQIPASGVQMKEVLVSVLQRLCLELRRLTRADNESISRLGACQSICIPQLMTGTCR